MKKEWFVLNTLVGKEKKVQQWIQVRAPAENLQDFIGECLVPEQKVTEKKKNSKKRSVVKKILPGYVLCELAFYDEARGLDVQTRKRAIHERTWQFLRGVPGLIGFVGNRDQPVPLTKQELNGLLGTGTDQPPMPRQEFSVNDLVKIKDGAFMGMKGVVTVVDPNRIKLTVEVKIFSRKTPVDVESWQVEKLTAEEAEAFSKEG